MTIRISLLVLVTALFVAICASDRAPEPKGTERRTTRVENPPLRDACLLEESVTIPGIASETSGESENDSIELSSTTNAISQVTVRSTPVQTTAVRQRSFDTRVAEMIRRVSGRKSLRMLARRLTVLQDELRLAEQAYNRVPLPLADLELAQSASRDNSALPNREVAIITHSMPTPAELVAGRYRVVNDRGEVGVVDIHPRDVQDVATTKDIYMVTDQHSRWYFIRMQVELLAAPDFPAIAESRPLQPRRTVLGDWARILRGHFAEMARLGHQNPTATAVRRPARAESPVIRLTTTPDRSRGRN